MSDPAFPHRRGLRKDKAVTAPAPAHSLGHHEHPLLGHPVIDTATGRVGILRAICPEQVQVSSHTAFPVSARSFMAAWLAPIGGGREWTTAPSAIQEADRDPRTARESGR